MPEEKPRVSILIPVYNRERLIGPAIESSLAQEFPDFEVVVVDNHSTDDTWEVCSQFSARDSRVRAFRNDRNLGPVLNWRRCIELARGEFSKILFSDDLISRDYLAKTVPLLEDPEVGFVFSAVKIGAEEDSSGLAYNWKRATKKLASDLFVHDLYAGGPVPVSPGCALFRTKDLLQNLLTHIPSPTPHDCSAHGAGPDVLLYLLASREYPKVGFVAEPLAFFRSHKGSFTVDGMSGRVREGYNHALSWFGEKYFDRAVFRSFLIVLWLRHVWGRKILVSPARVWAEYLFHPEKNWLVLAGAAGQVPLFFLRKLIFKMRLRFSIA